MTRVELIAKLLLVRHLSAAEREALGGNEITLDEIAFAIKQILAENKYFPPGQSPWKQGESVYERFIIERLANGKFRLHRQRAHPLAPWQLVEKQVSDYRNLDPILKEFLRWEWPRGIDGISIKRRSLWSRLISNFK